MVRFSVVWRALGVALALSLSALPVAAQTVSFGPSRSTTHGGGVITFDLPVPANLSDPGTLNLIVFGDLGAPSQGEALAVSFNGTDIGVIAAAARDCSADHSVTLQVPAALMAQAAAEGRARLRIADDAPGRVHAICATDQSQAFSFSGSDTAFAVRGSLTLPTAAAPPPDTPVAAAPTGSDEDFLASRGTLILSNGMSTSARIGRLIRGAAALPGGLSFQGRTLLPDLGFEVETHSQGLRFLTGHPAGEALFWAEGRLARISDNTSTGTRFGILHVGADLRLNRDIMLGFAASHDRVRQTMLPSGDLYAARGWMLGPVMTARLHQNVYIDARLAFGRASNAVTRRGFEDRFNSTRRLAELAIIGDFSNGAVTIFPELEISYFHESSEAYAMGGGGVVQGSEAAIAQARIGSTVEHEMVVEGGRLTGYVEAFGVYTGLQSGAVSAGSLTDEVSGWSGEAGLGFRFRAEGGATLSGNVRVGGLFQDASTRSASIELNLPLD